MKHANYWETKQNSTIEKKELYALNKMFVKRSGKITILYISLIFKLQIVPPPAVGMYTIKLTSRNTKETSCVNGVGEGSRNK